MTAMEELIDNYKHIAENALGITRGNLEDTIRSANRAVVAEAQKRLAEDVSNRCVSLCAMSMLFSLAAFIFSIIVFLGR